ADFSDAFLQDSTFTNAGLFEAKFDRADMRGAVGFTGVLTTTTNTILPNGVINNLDLTTSGGGHMLVVRDYNGKSPIPIHVTKGFTLDSSSTLVVRLKDGTWGSTISFDPDIPVTLGGTLDLGFDTDADLADIFGKHIQLFDWTTSHSGTFSSIV